MAASPTSSSQAFTPRRQTQQQISNIIRQICSTAIITTLSNTTQMAVQIKLMADRVGIYREIVEEEMEWTLQMKRCLLLGCQWEVGQGRAMKTKTRTTTQTRKWCRRGTKLMMWTVRKGPELMVLDFLHTTLWIKTLTPRTITTKRFTVGQPLALFPQVIIITSQDVWEELMGAKAHERGSVQIQMEMGNILLEITTHLPLLARIRLEWRPKVKAFGEISRARLARSKSRHTFRWLRPKASTFRRFLERRLLWKNRRTKNLSSTLEGKYNLRLSEKL